MRFFALRRTDWAARRRCVTRPVWRRRTACRGCSARCPSTAGRRPVTGARGGWTSGIRTPVWWWRLTASSTTATVGSRTGRGTGRRSVVETSCSGPGGSTWWRRRAHSQRTLRRRSRPEGGGAESAPAPGSAQCLVMRGCAPPVQCRSDADVRCKRAVAGREGRRGARPDNSRPDRLWWLGAVLATRGHRSVQRDRAVSRQLQLMGPTSE